MNKRFYRFLCALLRPYYALFFPARVTGAENIPREGGFILCSNHCSNHDPFYLALRAPGRCLRFMAKSNLFKWKIVGKLVTALGAFSVDRGHSDLAAVRTSLQLLKEGHGLAIFPQGTRIKDNHPAPMLDGVSMIALRAGVPVIPAYIGGPYRLFRRTQVSFGKPVSFEGLPRRVDSETLSQATRRIEDAVFGLKKG
jgi:1-acyl-sn-glycerol-3-phosphate acyltransferase